MLSIDLSESAVKDIYRLRKENAKYAAKLWDLILNIHKNPFDGLGQPEALKGDLQGHWSRRITGKHRLVYKLEGNIIRIVSCFGHYDDK